MLLTLAEVAHPPECRREPGFGLQDGGDDVAMGQHRALRQPGGAAGVLQEGDRIERLRRSAASVRRARRDASLNGVTLRPLGQRQTCRPAPSWRDGARRT